MAHISRALIVGGGIGGLSVAAALQKVGMPAEVFEQAGPQREVGAGVGLWSNALASLDQFGAGDAIRKSCTPIRTLGSATSAGRDLGTIRLDDLSSEFAEAACFIALRPMLLAALQDRVSPQSIHTDSKVVGIEAGSSRDGAIETESSGPGEDLKKVRLRLEDGRTEAGDIVIAADGLNSLVRPIVVGPDEIRYSGQTAFRGVAKFRAPEGDVIREIQGAGQRGSVCPVDGETVYWWAAHNAPARNILPQNERKPYLLKRYKDWPFGLEQAIAATPDEAILQNDLVDRPPAGSYVKGRIVLLGDAAHPTTPNLGQGANMAIDDAIVLARCLRDAATIEQGLARYQDERLARTRKIVEWSWKYGEMSLWTSPIAVALRELSARLLPKSLERKALRWHILETVGTL